MSRSCRNRYRPAVMSGVLAAGVLVVGWVGGVPAGAAAPVVTTYTNPSISGPQGITTGSDGAVWFTNEDSDSIGRVTTAGTVTNYTDSTISSPPDITAGPDGALWFTNFDDSIGRITTAGAVTNYTGPGISDPVGIAAGPDGALWFTNNTNSSIGRITTAGTVTNYRDAHISGPGGIIAGPDHALWFTNFTNSSIGRITTAGTVTDYTDPSIASPADITVGADDALWFANFNNSSIGRITTPATPLLAPNPPTAVRATSDATTRGSGAVTVSYRAGAARGTTVTRFTATCTSNDGGATRNGVHNGPTSTSITVGGLNTKRIYRCRVGATSAQGTSPPSALSNTVTVGAPGLPRPPRVVRVGAGHVKVSFTAPASNGAPIIAVKAVCRSSNGGVTKAKTGTAGPLGVKGLTAAKSYTCTVTATNRRGTGPTSVPSAPVTA